MDNVFLIIDGNSLLHRAYHALPLMDTGGIYTNAIHGFMMMMIKAVREENAKYLAVCFDEHAPTFRHLEYAEYKAGRQATPEELKQQFRTIRELLSDMRIAQYSAAGWEADDLLGTLSKKGAQAGMKPLLLTGDRDALQLVNDEVTLLFTRKGISETVHYTPSQVEADYGFPPSLVTDWKGLAGDSSDNIPGITGIGDKTAVKLLQKYGPLEEILAHWSDEKGKLSERLQTGAEIAMKCKHLATIRCDAPVELEEEKLRVPDFAAGIPALKKLQLNQVIRRISADGAAVSAAAAPSASAAEEMEAAEPPVITLERPEKVNIQLIDNAESMKAALEQLTADDRPIAVCAGEGEITIATQKGEMLRVLFGGDLLTLGLTPQEALPLLEGEMKAHPCVVYDSKEMMHLMRRNGCEGPETFEWDVMLGSYLLNPQEKSYALKELLGDMPADALSVLLLYRAQKPLVEQQGMMRLMREVEMPLALALYRMEALGFLVDRNVLEELGRQYDAQIETLRKAVIDACGAGEFNLNSPIQLGEVLFEKLGLPHGKKTTRGYSTAVDVLESLEETAPQVITSLLRYRTLMKLKGTYIDGLLRLMEKNGRIHSSFNQTATATGRISSSEPNLQNIPVRTDEGREIRRAFLPREGWVLLDADYSQIELRLMAHFSRDAALVESFVNHQDVHARTASEIFEVPLSQVDKTLRSRAKAVNFGLIYGISGFGLARNTGVTQQEAREFISRYFAKYPGVKRFMDDATGDGMKRGYALTMMNRRRYLPELQSPRQNIREFGKRAAMNTPVQGTAADIIKLAMVRVDEALRRENMQSRLVLQVHDELLLECPPEEAEKAAALLQKCMEEVITLSVPLEAEVNSGSNWAEAH